MNTKVTDDARRITGMVGTNVEYAPFQEFRFHGTQKVKQSLRKITQAFGKPLKEPVTITVKALTRKVNCPAHSCLRSALAEMSEEVTRELRAALVRAIK